MRVLGKGICASEHENVSVDHLAELLNIIDGACQNHCEPLADGLS